jgi:hypothetical protein
VQRSGHDVSTPRAPIGIRAVLEEEGQEEEEEEEEQEEQEEQEERERERERKRLRLITAGDYSIMSGSRGEAAVAAALLLLGADSLVLECSVLDRISSSSSASTLGSPAAKLAPLARSRCLGSRRRRRRCYCCAFPQHQ